MLDNLKSWFNSEPNVAVPEWAALFESHEYLAFVGALKAYFNKKNLQYTLTDGVVEMESNPFGFGTMGLGNLVQSCKQHEPQQYEALVAQHFDSLQAAHTFNEDFQQKVHDFESVKAYIGMRLYASSYVQNIEKPIQTGYTFAEDIIALLIFDMPHSVINVQTKDMQKWGKTRDELFAIAKVNIQANYPVKMVKHDIGETHIWAAHADHFFTANLAFHLDEHPELVGSKGALVALPHRHTAIFHPIEDLKMLQALNTMLPMVYGMHAEGPGSLSPHLYWYNNGVFTDLPYTIEGQNLEFSPPAEFVAILEEMEA
jgi:hypothetical protein